MSNFLKDYIEIKLPFCDMDAKTASYSKYACPIGLPETMENLDNYFIERELFYIASVGVLLHNYIDYDDILLTVYEKTKSYVRVNNRQNHSVLQLLRQMKKERTEYLAEKVEQDEGSFVTDVSVLFEKNTEYKKALRLHRLSFDLSEIENGTLNIIYDGNRIHVKYVEWISRNFESILTQLSDNLNLKADEINVLGEKEKSLLEDFNGTKVEYDDNFTLYSLFQNQVERAPDQIALKYEDITVTYAELEKKVSILATYLHHLLKGEKIPIGIYIHRSIEMVTAMLGVMRAGCAYVPLDPNYPKERIEYMAKQCDMRYILIHDRTKELGSSIVDTINIEEMKDFDEEQIKAQAESEDLAYIIFTSGSTGQPKGVPIRHRNIVNTLQWRQRFYEFSVIDAILQMPSFSFDSSVEDIFTPLICGATLVLMNEEDKFNISALSHLIEHHGITNLLMLPSYYRVVLPKLDTSMRGMASITLAGEAINTALVQEHFNRLPNIRLFSECGPTEASVNANIYEFKKGENRVLLGKPIDNVRCHVVNRWNRLSPIGGVGECYIESPGVAKGYLRGKQSEQFMDIGYQGINPYYRMYKSGDIVHWTEDGNLRFAGRRDNQVKIRGYRIELGEVEKHILDTEFVEDMAVTVNINADGEKYLEAFLVLKQGKSIEELQSILEERVPGFMVPSFYTVVKELKKLPNGKIDRNGLEEIKDQTSTNENTCISPIEKKLLDIFREILKVDGLEVDVPLERYGITSLQIITAIYETQKALSFSLTTTLIHKQKTIRSIAEFIAQSQGEEKLTDLNSAIEKLNSQMKIQTHCALKDGKQILTVETASSIEERRILEHIEKHFDRTIWPNEIVYSHTDNPMQEMNSENLMEGLISEVSAYVASIIKESNQKACFSLSGMQMGHIMIPNRYTGDIFRVDRTMLEDRIQDTLRELVRSQLLLHSSPVYEKGTWIWKEYEVSDELDFPYVDLSAYTEQDQYSFLEEIYNRLYFIDYNKIYRERSSLPYLFIIVKRSLCEHLILFFADHIIYDAVSFELIGEALRTLRVNSPAADFRQYVSMIEDKYMNAGIEENSLIAALNMDEFSEAMQRCYNNIKKLEKGNIKKYKLAFRHKKGSEEVLKHSLYLYSSMVKDLISVTKLPVCILNYGRKYGESSYYDVIGEFVDIIPTLVDSEDMMGTMDTIARNNKFLSDNHGNITTILFHKKVRTLYKQFLKRFLAVPDVFTPNFLKFNFVGYKANASSSILNKIFEEPDKVNFAERNDGIVCEVFCLSENEFEMEIYTEYEIDNLSRIIQNLCEKEDLVFEGMKI